MLKWTLFGHRQTRTRNTVGFSLVRQSRVGWPFDPKDNKIKWFMNQDSLWKMAYTVLKEREMFYLTTHSTHFIYGYMASDIWLRTILIVRKEIRCCHIGYSYRLTARVLLYAPSHRQDNTYHGLCYTSREALARTRNSSMGPPHEGSIRRPIAPWANALTAELHLAPWYGSRGLTLWSKG